MMQEMCIARAKRRPYEAENDRFPMHYRSRRNGVERYINVMYDESGDFSKRFQFSLGNLS